MFIKKILSSFMFLVLSFWNGIKFAILLGGFSVTALCLTVYRLFTILFSKPIRKPRLSLGVDKSLNRSEALSTH